MCVKALEGLLRQFLLFTFMDECVAYEIHGLLLFEFYFVLADENEGFGFIVVALFVSADPSASLGGNTLFSCPCTHYSDGNRIK